MYCFFLHSPRSHRDFSQDAHRCTVADIHRCDAKLIEPRFILKNTPNKRKEFPDVELVMQNVVIERLYKPENFANDPVRVLTTFSGVFYKNIDAVGLIVRKYNDHHQHLHVEADRERSHPNDVIKHHREVFNTRVMGRAADATRF